MKSYIKPVSINTNLLKKSSSFMSGFSAAFGAHQVINSKNVIANVKFVQITK